MPVKLENKLKARMAKLARERGIYVMTFADDKRGIPDHCMMRSGRTFWFEYKVYHSDDIKTHPQNPDLQLITVPTSLFLKAPVQYETVRRIDYNARNASFPVFIVDQEEKLLGVTVGILPWFTNDQKEVEVRLRKNMEHFLDYYFGSNRTE